MEETGDEHLGGNAGGTCGGKLDEHIVLQADSNTAITKGIIAMLVRVLDGLSPAEVQQHPLSFIEAIGLHEHLSSQRSNGLHSMIQTLRKKAESYS